MINTKSVYMIINTNVTSAPKLKLLMTALEYLNGF